MKRAFFPLLPLAVIFFGMACSFSLYPAEVVETPLSTTLKPASPNTAPPPVLSTTFVIAERALWLRETPNGQRLIAMPAGSGMIVERCEVVENTGWAFGTFVDDSGKHWVGYAAARYLSDIDCMEEK